MNIPIIRLITAAAMIFSLQAQTISSKTKPKSAALDSVLLSEQLWKTSLVDLEKKYHTKPSEDQKRMEDMRREMMKKRGVELPEQTYGGFEWLSTLKDGLRGPGGRLSLFERDLGEVVVKGNAGLIAGLNLSIYNRGDDQPIKSDELLSKFQDWKTLLDGKLGAAGVERKSTSAVKVLGFMWKKGDTAWLLEASVGKDDYGMDRAEFLRIRLASASNVGAKKIAGRSTLAGNVVHKENGDTLIEVVPMVDQGQKGYCAVASISRVAMYYGLDVDQHEIAQLANTSHFGTSPEEMEEAFKKIVGKLHIRTTKHYELTQRQFDADVRAYNQAAKKVGKKIFEAPKGYILNPGMVWMEADPEIFAEIKGEQSGCKRYMTKVREYIDQGLPICWCLRLGMFKEKDIPQASGGHMRLIIGYNEKTSEIIYSDSWGKGHECKRMSLDKAYACSMSLYTMSPTR